MTLIDPNPNNEICLRNKSDTELNQQFCWPPRQDDQNQLALAECPLGDGVLQNVGCGEATDTLPYFGNVSIENSTDVHIGDKNIYHGAVTIKQIVYASLPEPISKELEQSPVSYCRDGLGSHQKLDNVTLPNNTSVPFRPDSRTGKGVIWLRDTLKTRPRETAGCCILVLLIFVVALVTSMLLTKPSGKPVQSFKNELDMIQPVDYNPDITINSQKNNTKLRITSRGEWVSQPPVRPIKNLTTPVPYVVIYHTATDNCTSHAKCVYRVRFLQSFFIESMSFHDIGYNFLVGGDGAIYEGRGWTTEGGYVDEYDRPSISIAFIGTFTHAKPPELQVLICQRLIELGLKLGYINKDYKLIVSKRLTENSRTALVEEVKTWPHWAGNS
ncbi:hypothetical protein GWI33_018330 [Rhynchophorus ferrugineus]|uniref:Peptidoglycan recognition protein family domain-containing protein n=1 Tax=Rhynchophorus ferrugineus TaxID=354439 RepID=A0A834HY43_RHYFE|nr:hypothetical protein GWI33_018330 [Rhynchophorus ferrugineus]